MSVSTINEIFAKRIDRSIEGVVKADDASQLATEVEEYVLTNEAAKGLEHVLEAYTNYTNANGVWISGFFGSGKSHLLKMLAHLLGDIDGHDYPRDQVSGHFQAKAEDAFLPALIQKADRIPARSLLFNIDQKATLISKDQKDALLKVFVKIFDESRGYYGNQGHIARFEHDLDGRGQYSAFKAAFERYAAIPWSQGREQSVLEAENIDKAFAEVNGSESPGIIRQYRASYSVSIEDFADEVATWLDQQPEGYRLNFFVDEVGQFIGTDTQLMLNLQTIAETLATKCKGRAWVFVTSQEDMEKVGGDRTKQQANDFSKIQARFKNRFQLTSRDVEEVIRKRLLAKTETAADEIAAIYNAEYVNFKTLFDFAEGRHYPNYRDKSHFVGTYPFVSYQFPLFQSAIEGISDHNIFEGRNSSVGERSMLGVVQQVATELADKPLGTLATFDQMFEGIRASLKSAHQRAINDAERSPSLPHLAVRLLKTLFLVKYLDTFKATARNLTVLVYDRFGTDLAQLGKDVKASLNALEAQTYIQRNGDLYDYLTNEEQKIEQEIKNVDIDSSEVSGKLHKLLSESIVKSGKAAYRNGQNFPFGYKLDGTAYGRQFELTLHFTTPELELSLEAIKAHTAQLDELRVVLPDDAERILGDLRLLLKTEKYVKRAQGSSRTAVEQRILQTRATQNAEREKEIVDRLRTAVGTSTLVHNAAGLEVTSSDAQTRIHEGFQQVIAATYTNLVMLGGKTFTEQSLGGLVNAADDALIEQNPSQLEVPGGDVLGHLELRGQRHEQVTMRQLVDRYTGKPFGWDQWSLTAVLAYLAGQSKVEIQLNGRVLARTEVTGALRNTQSYSAIVVAPQRVFDPKTVNAFRKFVVEFTNEGGIPKDPLELARAGKERLEATLTDLRNARTSLGFPFIGQLDEPIERLAALCGHKVEWFITEFRDADELLEAKENVIDPIKAFLNGSQRRIFENAQAVMKNHQANVDYLTVGPVSEVAYALDDEHIFRGNKTHQLDKAVNELEQQLNSLIETERADARDKVNNYWRQVPNSKAFVEAPEEAQHSVTSRAESVLDRVQQATQIPTIRNLTTQFAETIYPEILDELEASKAALSPAPQSTSQPGISPETAAASGPTTPTTVSTVSIQKLDLPGTGQVLETTVDVDAYLTELRATLLTTINDNKRITL